MSGNSDFGIKKSDYSTYSTNGVTISDDETCAKYSKETVEKAKLLKAKYGDKYSDRKYLEYAKSMTIEEFARHTNSSFQKSLSNQYIQDIEWAQFSYEEIIEMENSGYNIPKEVILWARAQQQSDITDYVVISENSAEEDNSEPDKIDNPQQLNTLRTKALEKLAKSEQITEEMEEATDKYKNSVQNIQTLKTEKEESIKKSQNKFEKDTEEWKNLNSKNELGTLTDAEKKRFSELSETLNNEQRNFNSEITKNNFEIEEFLNDLENIQNLTMESEKIVDDTIQAAKDLSKYEKPYNGLTQPVIQTAMFTMSDNYYTINLDTIADTTLNSARDTDNLKQIIQEDFHNSTNNNLKEFANKKSGTNFNTEPETDFNPQINNKEEQSQNTQIQDNNQNTQEKENSQSQQTQNSENTQQETPLPDKQSYNVSMEFSAQNSVEATNTTNNATSELKNKELEIQRTNENVISQTNIGEKTSKELQIAQKQLNNEIINKQNLISEQQTFEQKEKPELSMEQTQAPLNIKLDEQIVQTAVQKQQANDIQISGLQKQTDSLNNNKNNFEEIISKQKDVSSKTLVVGAGTMEVGAFHAGLGYEMMTSGAVLMSNPFTLELGILQTVLGQVLIQSAVLEEATGIAAGVSAALGLNENKNAQEISNFTNNSLSNATKQLTPTQAPNLPATPEISPNTPTENQINEQEETKENNENIQQQIQPVDEDQEQLFTQEKINDNRTKTQQSKNTNTAESAQTQNQTELSEEQDTSNQDEITKGENTQQQNENKQQTYAVQTEFSAANSAYATNTTIKATTEMLGTKSQVETESKNIASAAETSKKTISETENTMTKIDNNHKTNLAQLETITAQNEQLNSIMETTDTEDEAISAQVQSQNLAAQYSAIQSQDINDKTLAQNAINNGFAKTDNLQALTNELNSQITPFSQILNNQKEVSDQTVLVGFGTTGLGMFNANLGTEMIASGAIMMTNPFTLELGILQTILGENLVQIGTLEGLSGAAATVTGVAGIAENNKAQQSQTDASSVLNSANSDLKSGNSILKQFSETKNPEDIRTNFEQKQVQFEDEEEQQNDDIALAASATFSINLNDTVTTDDKADRRLTRFNTDSMIESKRRHKKVIAVSSSAKS